MLFLSQLLWPWDGGLGSIGPLVTYASFPDDLDFPMDGIDDAGVRAPFLAMKADKDENPGGFSLQLIDAQTHMYVSIYIYIHTYVCSIYVYVSYRTYTHKCVCIYIYIYHIIIYIHNALHK